MVIEMEAVFQLCRRKVREMPHSETQTKEIMAVVMDIPRKDVRMVFAGFCVDDIRKGKCRITYEMGDLRVHLRFDNGLPTIETQEVLGLSALDTLNYSELLKVVSSILHRLDEGMLSRFDV